MIIGPTAAELLEAVSTFLGSKELRQGLPPDLAFRALVASSLCAQVRGELEHGAALEAAQVARLGRLLGPGTPGDLEARLCASAGDRGPGTPVWNHAMESLREIIRVANPRFDLRREVP